MRAIKPTRAFQKDFRREMTGKRGKVLQQTLSSVIDQLARNVSLSPRFKEHALKGKWARHRECHLRPDLLLIYRKPDNETLTLVRLGSHAELFD
uniref:mRNA interferase YafQ n=1 Tax=Candidatus Kentrum sp. FM TaxID=2126340 RepID=A0A450U1T2_9GAMM|nr:MAG: mRNA interferase YafQ [Candidatus Kentron sp. FM]VFJ76434.1 MAG: mRNA interferase YafQ [Candidatus Kentron sp. FM]VFK23093.1 MAG: mRNA interferase YafQ [Candidatus Kentron sp. FM]